MLQCLNDARAHASLYGTLSAGEERADPCQCSRRTVLTHTLYGVFVVHMLHVSTMLMHIYGTDADAYYTCTRELRCSTS
jgi:hypothetical protein